MKQHSYKYEITHVQLWQYHNILFPNNKVSKINSVFQFININIPNTETYMAA
jgi:hypothetical protein